MKYIQSILLLFFALSMAACGVTQSSWREDCPTVEPQVCPAPEVIEKVVVKEVPAKLPPMAKTAGKMHFPIIGAVEWATVEPSGLQYEARVDTGAVTTSIHAENIQLVEKDGKRYVRFTLTSRETGERIELERPLVRRVSIKQTVGENERRYVVHLWVSMGEIRNRIEVNLADRADFEFPLLLGRNFLTDTVIVDVSRHHTFSR